MGLCFTADVFFFATHSPRSPADRPDTLPHDRKLAEFYNANPKILVLSLNKIGGQNMRGQFSAISDFDREYLPNEATYPTSVKHLFYSNCFKPTREIPPAFDEKSPVNFGPLSTWNYMRVWTH